MYLIFSHLASVLFTLAPKRMLRHMKGMEHRDTTYDTIVLGAGAAGLFCAAHLGGRVAIIDHAKRPGEKIRISGGGRCNFTNVYTAPENFLSQNPHFCKSALSRYGPWDFIDLLGRHTITYHEKHRGQMFCDQKATAIVEMLRQMCAHTDIMLETQIQSLHHDGTRFILSTSRGTMRAATVVVATGGKSIPKMGATGLAYDIAQNFGHEIIETRPALVPLTFNEGVFSPLAGVAVPVTVSLGQTSFEEDLLFTHRGLSGPAILQISSFWREGESLECNFLPQERALDHLRKARQDMSKRTLKSALKAQLPDRMTDYYSAAWGLDRPMGNLSDVTLGQLADQIHKTPLTPTGSEGYRTAEVTLGGVDTAGLSSKTMQSTRQKGLFFIGEAVDVTGWLGGYNFQWAWASAYAAAQAINQGP